MENEKIYNLNFLITTEVKRKFGKSKKNEIIELIDSIIDNKDEAKELLSEYKKIYHTDLIKSLDNLASSYALKKQYLNSFIENQIITSEYPHEYLESENIEPQKIKNNIEKIEERISNIPISKEDREKKVKNLKNALVIILLLVSAITYFARNNMTTGSTYYEELSNMQKKNNFGVIHVITAIAGIGLLVIFQIQKHLKNKSLQNSFITDLNNQIDNTDLTGKSQISMEYLKFLIDRENKKTFGKSKKQEILNLLDEMISGKAIALQFLEKYKNSYEVDLIKDLEQLSSSYNGKKEYLRLFIEHEIIDKNYPHDYL